MLHVNDDDWHLQSADTLLANACFRSAMTTAGKQKPNGKNEHKMWEDEDDEDEENSTHESEENCILYVVLNELECD